MGHLGAIVLIFLRTREEAGRNLLKAGPSSCLWPQQVTACRWKLSRLGWFLECLQPERWALAVKTVPCSAFLSLVGKVQNYALYIVNSWAQKHAEVVLGASWEPVELCFPSDCYRLTLNFVSCTFWSRGYDLVQFSQESTNSLFSNYHFRNSGAQSGSWEQDFHLPIDIAFRMMLLWAQWQWGRTCTSLLPCGSPAPSVFKRRKNESHR